MVLADGSQVSSTEVRIRAYSGFRAALIVAAIASFASFSSGQQTRTIATDRRTRFESAAIAREQQRKVTHVFERSRQFASALTANSVLFPNTLTFVYGGEPLNPTGAAAADFNRDGIPDLAVLVPCQNYCGGASQGAVIVEQVVYSSGGYDPELLVAGDLNSDGVPDLVAFNTCSDQLCATSTSVSVLLNNGDGTFQNAITTNLPDQPSTFYSAVAADFNSDGHLDLALVSGSTLMILAGNGDGTFQPALVSTYNGLSVDSMTTADFNSDGKPDLAIASGQQAVVLLGNGNNTFQLPVSYSTGGNAYAISTGAFTVDGKLDLAVVNDTTVAILRGNGDGSFQMPIITVLPVPFTTSLLLGDLNKDGKLDLVVGGGVLLGKGDGTFNAGRVYAGGGAAIGDFDGDGNLDVADVGGFPDFFDYTVSSYYFLLLGNGDGTLQGALESTHVSGTAIAVGDFDSNKEDDIAAVDGSSNLSVAIGNGDGTFKPAVSYSLNGATGSAVVASDFNRDQKIDLAVVGGSTLELLAGNGDGTFQPATTSGLNVVSASALATADFNGDGINDLVVLSGIDSSVQVLLANGSGGFRAQPVFFVAAALGVSVSDFNHDGKLDLAVLGQPTSVLLGNGDGSFQPANTYPLYDGAIPQAIATGDFNHDGKNDVIVAQGCDNCSTQLVVLCGNGDGTLQVDPCITGGNIQYEWGLGVAVADFDGDGLTDYLTAYGDNFIELNGDGNYYPIGASDPAIGDFNGDGKPDVVFAGPTVLLNITQGFRYAVSTQLASSANPAVAFQPVTFTATLQPAFNAGPETGTVTFSDGGTVLGTIPVTNGQAQFTTVSLSVGSHQITAAYSGDSTYLPSTSSVLIQVVNKAATRTKLSSSPNPSKVGQTVTFRAVVNGQFGGVPTGSVTFASGSKKIVVQLTNGVAKLSTSKLKAGIYKITATYSGDASFNLSTSPTLIQRVNP